MYNDDVLYCSINSTELGECLYCILRLHIIGCSYTRCTNGKYHLLFSAVIPALPSYILDTPPDMIEMDENRQPHFINTGIDQCTARS